jgi:serine protease Do
MSSETKSLSVRRAIRQFALALFPLICFSLVKPNSSVAAPADSQVMNEIFEVVSAKPLNDPLTYSRPLPLDLLPFQVRNDKYHSIGTAFALGGDRYVTAAHVLNATIGGLWGAPALRDAAGHIYAVSKIEKYSLARDFAVFTVVGGPAAPAPGIDTDPPINSVVYAVGNALAEGIVQRDGLYTSRTPEEQDGRWSWLRFSAAASPGNSGGPLLDKEGAIIGMVLARSQNENLNYALPIEEILRAPDHLADIDNRLAYRLELFDTTQNGVFKLQFALPLSFAEFSAAFLKAAQGFSDAQLKALLAKDPDNVFPNGGGSAYILRDTPRMVPFPSIIRRETNGRWVMPDRKGTRTALRANGYVAQDSYSHDLLFHLRKPDDLPAAQLYGDPEGFAKLLLNTGFMQRTVGSEKVQVTGLGQPILNDAYTDRWQRRWQVRVWPLAYANAMFVTLSLPVPDGYVTLARYGAAPAWHDDLIDLKAITDFTYASYWGTLAQWKDFLTVKTLVPPQLSSMRVEFQYGERMTLKSSRINLTASQDLLAIKTESLLGLGFQYLNSDGSLNWDIGDVRFQSDSNDNGHWINIARHLIPTPELDDSWRSWWEKLEHRNHPWDGASYTEDDTTRIAVVVDKPADKVSQSKAPSVFYTAFVGNSGNVAQDKMRADLDSLIRDLQINER